MTAILDTKHHSESFMLSEVHAHWKAAIGIITVVVAAMVMAYALTNRSMRLYTADARLVVTAGLGLSGTGSDDVLEAPRLGQTYAVLATTRPVLLDVIQRTGLSYTPDELAGSLSVIGDLDSPFLTVSMTDPIPERAATVANALAEILVDRGTVPPTGIGAGATPGRAILAVAELATIPQDPSSPRVAYNTALAGVVALIMGLVIVAGIAYMRQGTAGRSGSRAE